MSGRTAVVAALPREVAGLVRGVAPDAALRGRGIWLYRLPEAVVLAAGMGAGRAALGVEAALAEGGVTTLVSAGLAGACSAEVSVGSVVEAAVVVDTSTGERFGTRRFGAEPGVVLATTVSIASVAEKARLHVAYTAQLVDMEAATVARLARAHGLEFRAIKGVSDAHDFELAGLERFAGRHGSFRTAAFAAHVALRPWMWGRAMELGRGSGVALKGLDAALRAAIAR